MTRRSRQTDPKTQRLTGGAGLRAPKRLCRPQRFRKVEKGHWRAALSEAAGSGVGRRGRKPETTVFASLAGRSLRVWIVKERGGPCAGRDRRQLVSAWAGRR